MVKSSGCLSNLPITQGSKVYLYFLATNSRKQYHQKTNYRNLISNDLSNALFYLFCPSIEITMGDYNKIEFVKETKTTKFLEKYFKADIVDIITFLMLNYDRSNPAEENQDILEDLTYIMEHKDIHEQMFAHNHKHYKLTSEISDSMVFDHFSLKKLGFNLDENFDTNNERYFLKYSNKNITSHYIITDRTSIKVISNKTHEAETSSYFYHTYQLINFFPEYYTEEFKKTLETFDTFEAQIKSDLFFTKKYKKYYAVTSPYYKRTTDIFDNISSGFKNSGFNQYFFKEEFFDIKDIANAVQFNIIMLTSNKILMPTYTTEETGYNKELASIILDKLK